MENEQNEVKDGEIVAESAVTNKKVGNLFLKGMLGGLGGLAVLVFIVGNILASTSPVWAMWCPTCIGT